LRRYNPELNRRGLAANSKEEPMGRFVHRFEDQSRPLGKFDGAAETARFLGRLTLATLLVGFLAGVSWMMATGDSHAFMRILKDYF